MRHALAEHERQILHVRAVFGGYRHTTKGRRVIIVFDVVDCRTDQLLTDHLWINHSSEIKRAKPAAGDTVTFSGEVQAYRHHGVPDYELRRIHNFKIERRAKHEERGHWKKRVRE